MATEPFDKQVHQFVLVSEGQLATLDCLPVILEGGCQLGVPCVERALRSEFSQKELLRKLCTCLRCPCAIGLTRRVRPIPVSSKGFACNAEVALMLLERTATELPAQMRQGFSECILLGACEELR